MLTITYETRLEDLVAFYRLLVETGGVQRQVIPLRSIATIACLFVFAVVSRGRPSLFWLVGVLVSALVYMAFPRVYSRHAAENASRLPAARGVLCPHTLSLSAEGVSDITAVSSGKLQWGALHCFAETDSHVLIFATPLEALIVPKAQVEGPDLTALLGVLEQHLRRAGSA